MNVDIAALRAIERDKDIPFETVLEAIETALLTAYQHTEGHQPHARVDIDRKTGVVRVLAQETGPDGARRHGVGRHPRGLRPDRGHHRPPGDPAAAARRRERAHLRRVRGQGGRDRRRGRAARRPANARGVVVVAGRRHRGRAAAGRAGAGGALRARRAAALLRRRRVRGVRAARRSRCRGRTRTSCASCSRSRCPRSSTAPWRSSRSRGRPGTAPRSPCGRRCRGQPQGRVHRADGRPGARRDERAGRREDRHHRLVGRPRDVRRQRPVAVEGRVGDACSTRAPRRPRDRARLPALPGDRQGGQNARLAARLTGWRIDIRSDADPRVDRGEPRIPHRCPDGVGEHAGAARTPGTEPR